jgi:hypothetical protein
VVRVNLNDAGVFIYDLSQDAPPDCIDHAASVAEALEKLEGPVVVATNLRTEQAIADYLEGRGVTVRRVIQSLNSREYVKRLREGLG